MDVVVGERRWILDDGALELLAKNCDFDRLLEYCSRGVLLVAGTTVDAAKYERRALLDLTTSTGTLLESFDVLQSSDDPAAEVLAEIRQEANTDKHLAEHEAISWALVHGPGSVLVTMDQGAMRDALAELGPQRVCYPFDLWFFLLEINALSPAGFEILCEATKRHDKYGLKRMPERVRSKFPSTTG